MNLPAGKLRHRVTIQEYAALLDSNGDVIQDETTGVISRAWTDVASVWAAIEPLSAREFIQSGATQSQVQARITIRYRSGLNSTMRFVHGSTIYNPEGFLADRESGKEYMTIPVSTGTNSG
jgi:SPP1 family predicted phage head-tail adaptor